MCSGPALSAFSLHFPYQPTAAVHFSSGPGSLPPSQSLEYSSRKSHLQDLNVSNPMVLYHATFLYKNIQIQYMYYHTKTFTPCYHCALYPTPVNGSLTANDDRCKKYYLKLLDHFLCPISKHLHQIRNWVLVITNYANMDTLNAPHGA